MIDPFVLLAPLLLLPVIALFRFVGCGPILGLKDRVEADPTVTVTLTISPSPPIAGQPAILSASVVAIPPTLGVPTGTVSFFDGPTLLQEQPNAQGPGSTIELIVTITHKFPVSGELHTITAQFKGTGNYEFSPPAGDHKDVTVT